ncbi:MAG TPA: hypothetical protein VGH62_15755 [Bradyrhizobium sp.]|jgi:hypothetical protein
MRVFALTTILLLSSSLVPAFAEDAGKTAGSNQSQTVPVQPERTPQQSEQYREGDRTRAEDVQVGRDWRTQQRDGDRMGRMDRNDMGRMMDQDSEHRTVGRGWRMRHDDDDRGYYDEDRPRRHVKICFEYENGDEYCRYRN